MDVPKDDFNLATLKCFLEEQVSRLDHDKASLQKFKDLDLRKSEQSYGSRSDVFNNTSVCEKMLSQTTNRETKPNKMVVKRYSDSHVIDTRESQKEKLIESLSLPKTNSNVKGVIKPSFTKLSSIPTVDWREKEKDRLAEIFSSSKPSHICKTPKFNSKYVNDSVCLDEYHPTFSTAENKENFKGSSEQSAVPEIFVSEHFEKLESKDNLDKEEPAMVRIGEFSPLNPNNMGHKPLLGIGEYSDERRKFMLAQRKQEYKDYLQQMQQQTGNLPLSRDSSPHSIKLRTVATQTEGSNGSNEEREISPSFCKKTSLFSEQGLLTREIPQMRGQFVESPVPNCFDDHCEREVKDLLYRQELKNQIEEKNRLKEQMRRREEEEEAKIEAKIQRDLEKMRRQYEEERLQRLELAIRRKEQEDILRLRLADEQFKVVEENKTKKKQHLRDKSIPPNDQACQKSTRYKQSSHYLPLSRSMPVSCASKALTEVNELLRQPHLEVPYDRLQTESVKLSPPERDTHLQKVSIFNQPKNISKSSSTAALSPRILRVNEDNNLRQDAVEPSLKRGVSSQTEEDPHMSMSEETAKKVKEVERMLKEPLMSHPDKVLLPVSPPLVDATIPPYIPSYQPPLSPPLPSFKRAQRTNTEILEDKWKVPNTETLDNKPAENVFTTHNRSVLTQLGAFRRHLQQERLRMQQRVRDDSP